MDVEDQSTMGWDLIGPIRDDGVVNRGLNFESPPGHRSCHLHASRAHGRSPSQKPGFLQIGFHITIAAIVARIFHEIAHGPQPVQS